MEETGKGRPAESVECVEIDMGVSSGILCESEAGGKYYIQFYGRKDDGPAIGATVELTKNDYERLKVILGDRPTSDLTIKGKLEIVVSGA